MLYVGYLLCLCGVLWFCFIDHKGAVADKLLCLFMFPLMAFAAENVNRPAYVEMYEYIDGTSKIGFTDAGFGLLMYIGRLLGLDYNSFMVVFTLIGLLFVVLTFRKLSDYVAISLAFYFALMFRPFTAQIHSIIAEALLYILAVRIVDQPLFDLKGFILLLALAVIFQATSLFFVLLPGIYIKKRKWLVVAVGAAIVAVPVMAAILKSSHMPLIQQNIQMYQYEGGKRPSIDAIVLVMGYIAVTCYVSHAMRKGKDAHWRDKLDRLLRVNLIGLVACVMVLVYSSDFNRIVQVILVVDIIVLCNRYFGRHRHGMEQRAIIGFLFVALFSARELVTREMYNLVMTNSLLPSLLGMY